MGQYFIIVNHTKREWLHPHRFGDGLKFKEFCGSASGVLAGLAHLLLHKPDSSGVYARWSDGDDIAIVGDEWSGEVYEMAMDCYKDVSFDVITEMAKDAYTRATLMEKVAWRREGVGGIGNLGCDPEEQEFYKELFDGRNH